MTVAILGGLIGLLVPAVQKVRAAAVRAASMNNVRQQLTAFHSYSSNKGGRLPGGELLRGPRQLGPESEPVYVAVRPYLDPAATKVAEIGPETVLGWTPFLGRATRTVSTALVNPADPTFATPLRDALLRGDCGYAPNGVAFATPRRLPEEFADGTHATVAVAERYANCQRRGVSVGAVTITPADSTPPPVIRLEQRNGPPYKHIIQRMRAVPFAISNRDVVPVTAGWPPGTRGSEPGPAFQVAPPADDCDHRRPQTPHPGGMVVGLFDGSVRTVRGDIDPALFWAAVTPAAGDSAGLD